MKAMLVNHDENRVSLGLNRLREILEAVKQKTVLVVGDYFLDKYLFIDESKNQESLETGLAAYQVVEKRLYPGAAGNVANNLSTLGFGKVIGLGILGDDAEGIELKGVLDKAKIDTSSFLITKDRVSPTYIKPVLKRDSQYKELNRIDIQNWTTCANSLKKELIRRIVSFAGEVDAIVVTDQIGVDNAGVITAEVREALSNIGKNLPVLVDSRINICKFENVILKPNQHEATVACAKKNIINCGFKLTKISKKPVFLTMGEQGQLVFDVDKEVIMVPAYPTGDKVDIVGAGDSTSAGIISALCTGSNIAEAALLGNLVSSVTVEKIGKAGTAKPEDLLKRQMQVGDIVATGNLDIERSDFMEE